MKLLSQKFVKSGLLMAFLGLSTSAMADAGRRVVTTGDGRGTAPSVRPGRPVITPPVITPSPSRGLNLQTLASRLVMSASELQMSSYSYGRYGNSGLSHAANNLFHEAQDFERSVRYGSRYNLRQELQDVRFAHQAVDAILRADRNLSARQISAKIGAQIQMIDGQLGYDHGPGPGYGHYDFTTAARMATDISNTADQVAYKLQGDVGYYLNRDEQIALDASRLVSQKAQQLEVELSRGIRSNYALSTLDQLSDELYDLEFSLPYISASYRLEDLVRELRFKVERLEYLLEHQVPVRTGRRGHRDGYRH